MARKTPKNPAYPISIEEATRLADGLLKHRKYRHSAFVYLSVKLGFRFGDIVDLTWKQLFRAPKKTLIIKEQKTGKTAKRILGDDLMNHIKICYDALGMPDSSEIIMIAPGEAGRKKWEAGKDAWMKDKKNNPNPGISIQSMNKTAKHTWIDLYDLDIDPSNFSMHSFRKTSAVAIAEVRGIHAAKKWLNHSSLEHTERYLLLKDNEVLSMNVEMNLSPV